jgi:exosortase J
MNTSGGSGSVSACTSSSSAPSPVTSRIRLGIALEKLVERRLYFWCSLAMVFALGCVGLSPQIIYLWEIWTTDPLRSIGMLIALSSVVLVLRVWRQRGWELRGTWWGMVPMALAFLPIILSQKVIFTWGSGLLRVNFLPRVFPIYLYATGVILMFAGKRVWRQAWFPLALLLCAQPMPTAVVNSFDLPLQGFSAHAARSFAALIGFPPTNQELLRLMFTPGFGMFIAPGCDGMRGAIALGYTALIVGYLKRVSFGRWILYVCGAVLLGHLFNLIRLCALVLYYRIAVGHPALESVAKQADYAIGGFLFLVSVVLFLWAVLRKEDDEISANGAAESNAAADTGMQRLVYWKVAAFAMLALIVVVPGVRAIRSNRGSLVQSVRSGDVTSKELDDLMPKQLGAYRLVRAWQEGSGSDTAIETAAYRTDASGEINLGVWLRPSEHSVHKSWLTHGESPEVHTTRSFVTARERTLSFDTAFYSDGVTDSLTGDVYCTPSVCLSSPENEDGLHLGVEKAIDFSTRGVRAVPIFFVLQVPHTDTPKAAIQSALLSKCQSFLSGVDFTDLSQKFQ